MRHRKRWPVRQIIGVIILFVILEMMIKGWPLRTLPLSHINNMGYMILGEVVEKSLFCVYPQLFCKREDEDEKWTHYSPTMEDMEAIVKENSQVLLEDVKEENNRKQQVENEQEEFTYVETLAGVPTGKLFQKKDLLNYDFLLQKFYLVDPTTAASDQLISGQAFLSEDMTLDLSGKEPVILIYHTHSQETYKDSRANEKADTVLGVGEYLSQLLEEKYGVAVYHDTSVYDMEDGKIDRNQAYAKAAVSIEKILKKYSSIQVVIDLHRDGVPEHVELKTNINGKKMAKIMFLNGLCRNNKGEEKQFAVNDNLKGNLAFSWQMQLKAFAYYPGLVRPIYLRAYRYNMHFKKRSLLVEVGAQNNTVEEAKNAMEPLAALLYAVLTDRNLPVSSP